MSPAADGSLRAAAHPLEEEERRLEAAIRELDARLEQRRARARPAPAARRTFGIGLAAGGGALGMFGLPAAASGGYGAGAVSPTIRVLMIEPRVFLANGLSVDISLWLGDGFALLFRNLGFLFESDVFLNFNPSLASGVNLLLGPGVGFRVGGLALAYDWSTVGAVRIAGQAGIEFLVAGGHLGLAFQARPYMELFFLTTSAKTWMVPVAGVLGLVSLSYYFVQGRAGET